MYYGCLKDTRCKWLDLERLFHNILKKSDIERIFYFTARVKPTSDDLDKHVRQETYFRALRTNPKIEIVFGHYLSHVVRMPLCNASGVLEGSRARVLKTEEKGSDVNLATYLMLGASLGDFDQAVVVSNDSDLLMPVRFVREKYGKRVGILNPHKRQSRVLAQEANFVRPIRVGAIAKSQFPVVLNDDTGEFRRPTAWA